jgi:hypothetical protein
MSLLVSNWQDEKSLIFFQKSTFAPHFLAPSAIRLFATSATSVTPARHRRRCRDVSVSLAGRLFALLPRKFHTKQAGRTHRTGDNGATSARHRRYDIGADVAWHNHRHRRHRLLCVATSAISAALCRYIGDIGGTTSVPMSGRCREFGPSLLDIFVIETRLKRPQDIATSATSAGGPMSPMS